MGRGRWVPIHRGEGEVGGPQGAKGVAEAAAAGC